MRHLFLTTLVLLYAGTSWATHIIGGEMYYDHLGGNQYRVTLVLFRDCGPDNVNGTGFDAAASIAVYNSAGTLVSSQSVSVMMETTVPVVLNDPCLSAPPTMCVSTTRYVQIFTLPPIPGGYAISYQRCCRTPAMANLQGQQGLTCTVHIPGPPDAVNSSPRFIDYPPIALCMGQDMTFDHSATDPDGDQLVYGLCDPLQGADAINPAPMASPPPYQPVNWAPGYSAALPLNSTPPLNIDPVTGILTVHPTMLGSFTVGVCVTEMRNGVVLGVSRRDFLFKVVICDAFVLAVIADQGPAQACSGLTQQFGNQSVNGQTWSWDFGEPGTTADVSTLQSPSWTYSAPGTYDVTLIANPGLSCSDTTIVTYNVNLPLDPVFTPPAVLCGAQEVTLTASGNFDASAVIDWDLGPGAVPSNDVGAEVTALFAANGAQPVTVTVSAYGCTDDFTANVTVDDQPVAAIGPQLSFCESLTQDFVNESVDATGYDWFFGDPSTSADHSTVTSPSWNYGVPGNHTVILIATNGAVCADTASLVFDVHEPPSPFFVRPAIRCPGELAVLHAWGASTSSPIIQWDLGVAGSPATGSGVEIASVFAQVGVHPVTITMTEFGCTASYTDSVVVYPRPIAHFTSDMKACVGQSFAFANQSTAWTPMTMHWDLGDGTTSTDSALVHVYDRPGVYTVSLTVSTATGCVTSERLTRPGWIEVFQSPIAAFTALPGEVSLLNPHITVQDHASLASEWRYSIAGQEVGDPSFTFDFEEGGQYIITQHVTSEHGCTDSTDRLVLVSDHIFYAPSAFTPDGDDLNDKWLPVVRGARAYELRIFDRWGHERFRTTDPYEGWSGDGLPQSTFVFLVKIQEWGSKSKEYAGHFFLLR